MNILIQCLFFFLDFELTLKILTLCIFSLIFEIEVKVRESGEYLLEVCIHGLGNLLYHLKEVKDR